VRDASHQGVVVDDEDFRRHRRIIYIKAT
jgi:hypothetical protein